MPADPMRAAAATSPVASTSDASDDAREAVARLVRLQVAVEHHGDRAHRVPACGRDLKRTGLQLDEAQFRERLKLLYVSCGNQDGLMSVAQGVHVYLKQQNIPHVWNVDDHGHDGGTWGSNLFHFAQRLFR